LILGRVEGDMDRPPVKRTNLLLPLAYGPVPDGTLAAMERAGKRLGLPLDTLELLGQERALCEDFVRAARDGRASAFLGLLDLEELRAALRSPPLVAVGAHARTRPRA
jgi:hypothetical protein